MACSRAGRPGTSVRPESAPHGIGVGAGAADRLVGRVDRGIERAVVVELVDLHGGADAERRRVVLAGGHEQVAVGHGQQAFRRQRARQQLRELRHAEPVDDVDRHEAAALRAHEQHVGVAVLREQDRFGLGALGVRTALRVVPEAHAEVFELVAAVVEDRAVEVEQREAAAAAVVVAFVGGRDAVAHPRHGVGLAEPAGLRVDEGDRVGHAGAGAHGVDLREVDGTGREVRSPRSCDAGRPPRCGCSPAA